MCENNDQLKFKYFPFEGNNSSYNQKKGKGRKRKKFLTIHLSTHHQVNATKNSYRYQVYKNRSSLSDFVLFRLYGFFPGFSLFRNCINRLNKDLKSILQHFFFNYTLVFHSTTGSFKTLA